MVGTSTYENVCAVAAVAERVVANASTYRGSLFTLHTPLRKLGVTPKNRKAVAIIASSSCVGNPPRRAEPQETARQPPIRALTMGAVDRRMPRTRTAPGEPPGELV